MANLIITVIAIALVAIASLMGAYYGGSAFLNNQSAANASTVLNQAQQIAGAWNAFKSDNLNAAPAALVNDLVTVGKYLAQIPQYPAGPGSASAPMVVGTPDNGVTYYAYADMGVPLAAVSSTEANASACDRIIKTAVGGTGPIGLGAMTTVGPGVISSVANNSGNGTFGCAATTAVTGGAIGTATIPAGHYVMEYKLQ